MTSVGAKLGLGTAQWGMPYGIANRTGRPSKGAITEMLTLAKVTGVRVLDTACVYGDAETMLGEQRAGSDDFSIITKTLPLRVANVTKEHVDAVVAAFAKSLERLQCSSIDGLLVHAAEDLLVEGGDRLWVALQDLQARKVVAQIGVSVYHPKQLRVILERFPVDIVQLPFNLYDNRFAETGLLSVLKRQGIVVHARSAFLQGLLLLAPDELPGYFREISKHHADLYAEFREAGVSPLEGALIHCLRQTQIDHVIVGCETLSQLEAILAAANRVRPLSPDLTRYSMQDAAVIDPSRWPRETTAHIAARAGR